MERKTDDEPTNSTDSEGVVPVDRLVERTISTSGRGVAIDHDRSKLNGADEYVADPTHVEEALAQLPEIAPELGVRDVCDWVPEEFKTEPVVAETGSAR